MLYKLCTYCECADEALDREPPPDHKACCALCKKAYRAGIRDSFDALARTPGTRQEAYDTGWRDAIYCVAALFPAGSKAQQVVMALLRKRPEPLDS